MAATGSPWELATQTATFDPVSPACPDSAVSRVDDHVRADGSPIALCTEDLDGFSISGELKGCEHSEGRIMNSMTDCAGAAFSRILHVDEKSEGFRQPDFRGQKMPASVSSSELSAHQMSEPLAGPSGCDGVNPEVTGAALLMDARG